MRCLLGSPSSPRTPEGGHARADIEAEGRESAAGQGVGILEIDDVRFERSQAPAQSPDGIGIAPVAAKGLDVETFLPQPPCELATSPGVGDATVPLLTEPPQEQVGLQFAAIPVPAGRDVGNGQVCI